MQGGIISPLLANVYLDIMDEWVTKQWELKNTTHKYNQDSAKRRALKKTRLVPGFLVRYADDFVIITDSREHAEFWKSSLKEFLETEMKLTLSKEKTLITDVRKKLLLSRSRRLGGSGFRYVHLNDLTPLSEAGQSITGQKVCYGDIVIVNPMLMKAVIIEIQGEVIHGSGAILDHDAERMTALQSMGIDVLLVTHDMLNNSKQLDTIVRSVCDRLGISYKAKTEAMKSAEMRLRANVLCNWLEIGK